MVDLTVDDVTNMTPQEAQDWVWEHPEKMASLTGEICAALLERCNP